MKIKYFLRGFGLGMMLVTLVMFAMYSYQTSDSQIIKKAQKLGMVYQKKPSNEDKTTKSEDKQTQEQSTTLPQNTTPAPTTTPQQSTTPQVTTPAPTTTPQPVTETEVQTTTKAPQIQSPTVMDSGNVQVNIHSGMTGVAFARMLEQVDVIADADDFISYLITTGYSHKLRAGTFVLRQGMSYEEIISVVGGNW